VRRRAGAAALRLALTAPALTAPALTAPAPAPPESHPQERDGKLRLSHFRRVKQLGAGDVGLVDLVQMQGTDLKFAMKTLDKWEMQERNKVRGLFGGCGRLRT
jgi:hypothetical protein